MSVQPLSWKTHTQMNLFIMSSTAHVLVNSRPTTGSFEPLSWKIHTPVYVFNQLGLNGITFVY